MDKEIPNESEILSNTNFPAIWFYLNKTQTKQLVDLFELAIGAYVGGKKGMVLMRLEENDDFRNPQERASVACFVPYKYAIKIQATMNDYYGSFNTKGKERKS